jgi:hypothetical protein
VDHGAIYFYYKKDDPWKETGKASVEWLLGLIKDHLRQGAKKFYYACMWEGDLREKDPKMKKIDLAKFELPEKGFDFGQHTIWEFVDSYIKQ